MTCATVACRDPAVGRGDQGSRIVTRDWLVRIGTAAVFPLAPGYGRVPVAAGSEAGWVPVRMRKRPPEQDRPTRLRVTASGMAGVVMAVLMGAVVGWRYAAAAGWTLAAAVFTGWTWRVIGGMGPRDTATHATGRTRPVR